MAAPRPKPLDAACDHDRGSGQRGWFEHVTTPVLDASRGARLGTRTGPRASQRCTAESAGERIDGLCPTPTEAERMRGRWRVTSVPVDRGRDGQRGCPVGGGAGSSSRRPGDEPRSPPDRRCHHWGRHLIGCGSRRGTSTRCGPAARRRTAPRTRPARRAVPAGDQGSAVAADAAEMFDALGYHVAHVGRAPTTASPSPTRHPTRRHRSAEFGDEPLDREPRV